MNTPAGPIPSLADSDVKALAWAVRRAQKTSSAFKSELAAAERAISRLKSLKPPSATAKGSAQSFVAANDPFAGPDGRTAAEPIQNHVARDRDTRFR